MVITLPISFIIVGWRAVNSKSLWGRAVPHLFSSSVVPPHLYYIFMELDTQSVGSLFSRSGIARRMVIARPGLPACCQRIGNRNAISDAGSMQPFDDCMRPPARWPMGTIFRTITCIITTDILQLILAHRPFPISDIDII